MNIKNQIVVHKTFGEGVVIEQSDRYISISFAEDVKNFVFPDSLGGFLKVKDNSVANEIHDYLESLNNKKQLIEQEKERQIKLEQERSATKKEYSPSKAKTKEKQYPRTNIAFKCNFCDGGKSYDQVGFDGVCSDDIIFNNIKIENRTWCNSDSSACRQYLSGEITRVELDDLCQDDGFVCYESQMLRDWKALAGIIQTGINKGKPMKLNQVQSNSLCVLTTRNPQSTEKERYIFAVFLVDETYEGDGNEEGYVTTKSEYKIKLDSKEARKFFFWNYHANENQPEVAVWSSGLHRYIEDEQAAQILRDIVEIKKGTKDEHLAKQFFDHFCSINGIDTLCISDPSGALSRRN